MTTSTAPRTVALLLGDPDNQGGASRVEELSFEGPVTSEGVTAQLAAAKISPSDVRARVELVAISITSAAELAVLQATLAGFVGRPIPATVAGGTVGPAEIRPVERTRPDTIEEQLIVAADSDLADPQVHFARRVVVDPSGLTPAEALRLVSMVAAVRKRPHHDRYPDVLTDEGEPVQLEEARKAGVAFRSDQRKPSAGSLAEFRDPSPRLQRLQRAAEAPIVDVLRRLGARHDETGEKWHCSRPQRHSNGDRNPSLKIVEGKTRCFRCDPEWVDSLRLVMDSLDMSPDEAAAWIESGEAASLAA